MLVMLYSLRQQKIIISDFQLVVPSFSLTCDRFFKYGVTEGKYSYSGLSSIIPCFSRPVRHGPFDILGGGGLGYFGKKFLALILT